MVYICMPETKALRLYYITSHGRVFAENVEVLVIFLGSCNSFTPHPSILCNMFVLGKDGLMNVSAKINTSNTPLPNAETIAVSLLNSRDRVVKATDLKSVGIFPRRFESCRLRCCKYPACFPL